MCHNHFAKICCAIDEEIIRYFLFAIADWIRMNVLVCNDIEILET